jgi:hypothetical protein
VHSPDRVASRRTNGPSRARRRGPVPKACAAHLRGRPRRSHIERAGRIVAVQAWPADSPRRLDLQPLVVLQPPHPLVLPPRRPRNNSRCDSPLEAWRPANRTAQTSSNTRRRASASRPRSSPHGRSATPRPRRGPTPPASRPARRRTRRSTGAGAPTPAGATSSPSRARRPSRRAGRPRARMPPPPPPSPRTSGGRMTTAPPRRR